jgi:hypothetical protein
VTGVETTVVAEVDGVSEPLDGMLSSLLQSESESVVAVPFGICCTMISVSEGAELGSTWSAD